MPKRKKRKINLLEEALPEGLLVDAAWLAKRGYSTSLRSQYVASGRLEQPARRVYRRPRGTLNWQQIVISLQSLLDFPVLVGGRTALELEGFAHYLTENIREVNLYGTKPSPTWLNNLSVGVRFVWHNDGRLFRNETVAKELASRNSNMELNASPSIRTWGEAERALLLSAPERAILELLDELPKRESFEQVDKLMANLPNLSPRRLQTLLDDCHNVKVKRLFFFFADRHKHAWLKRIDKKSVDLGTGKRMLVKGGKLDTRYQITVPEDLSAL
jgi:hypothetical protein